MSKQRPRQNPSGRPNHPPDIVTQEPVVHTPEDGMDLEIHGTYRRFWPQGKPMPVEYPMAKKPLRPCVHCHRVLMDNMAQAVVLHSTHAGLARFHCKVCEGKDWKLPIKVLS